jgi:hypothetical protein
MVKKYTDSQLLNKVKSLASFKNFPADYWILGVQSLEDVFNTFDDKFYLFKGQEFIMMSTGTTNAGVNGLLKYNTYNPTGYAVIKTNEWYYDVWKYGLHRKKMRALRQAKPFLISRDGNKDKKVDEGVSLPIMCGINFHTNTYALSSPEIKEIIGGFSLGCQVLNDTEKYYKFIDLLQPQKIVTYCLIKEF